MSLSLITNFISGIFKPAADLIDELHTSDEEKAMAKAKLLEIERSTVNKAVDLEKEIVKAQKDIIMTEAQGNWIQKSWRPILMWVIIFIVFNNFLLAPYMAALFKWSVVLELPSALWNLLTVGVGGYVVGRSGEKIVTKWKDGT